MHVYIWHACMAAISLAYTCVCACFPECPQGPGCVVATQYIHVANMYIYTCSITCSLAMGTCILYMYSVHVHVHENEAYPIIQIELYETHSHSSSIPSTQLHVYT